MVVWILMRPYFRENARLILNCACFWFVSGVTERGSLAWPFDRSCTFY